MAPKLKRKAVSKKQKFDYDVDFDSINFRDHPELYQVGKGEQGVLSVQPYKSEILPHWRFSAPAIAKESSSAVYNLFKQYRGTGDFVGMDMARKYLQMGFTRSRRYANHRSGIKRKNGELLPLDHDPIKAECAEIFKAKLEIVKTDEAYLKAKAEHLEMEARRLPIQADPQS